MEDDQVGIKGRNMRIAGVGGVKGYALGGTGMGH